ncbi:F-box/kelch-repeat protein [Thalictrum thalictroides]|uniref:F-box/kelch-repeat protein n=1 Tax=Thalictrum thalictroides TaxID=46969 RepID=A0A7J6UU93_THATH|nr:F-box/kelch-repeat protein [Thalictrum thalictroides]
MNEEEEDRWSQLPTLFLWMVIERSNFVDKVRIASVCKNWQLDSLTCPPKPRQKCVNPWIMLRRPRHESSSLVFTNPVTMEKLILDHPDINHKTEYLFSRRGWLLLRQLHSHGSWLHSIILLNLHTNAKITMPDPGKHVNGLIVSFSSINVDDDTPRCLVYATPTLFYIARVGDKTWTEHFYENRRRMETLASIIVRGDKVYFMDKLGKLFIHDMANLSWKTIAADNLEPGDFNLDCQWLIMESEEGEILKINQGKNLKTFSFFKLNESETDWKELNNRMDRRWFLCDKNNHHSAKETGGLKKVHKLLRYSEMICKYYQENPMIEIHNQSGRWVDLGWMDKVPPSCSRYLPN